MRDGRARRSRSDRVSKADLASRAPAVFSSTAAASCGRQAVLVIIDRPRWNVAAAPSRHCRIHRQVVLSYWSAVARLSPRRFHSRRCHRLVFVLKASICENSRRIWSFSSLHRLLLARQLLNLLQLTFFEVAAGWLSARWDLATKPCSGSTADDDGDSAVERRLQRCFRCCCRLRLHLEAPACSGQALSDRDPDWRNLDLKYRILRIFCYFYIKRRRRENREGVVGAGNARHHFEVGRRAVRDSLRVEVCVERDGHDRRARRGRLRGVHERAAARNAREVRRDLWQTFALNEHRLLHFVVLIFVIFVVFYWRMIADAWRQAVRSRQRRCAFSWIDCNFKRKFIKCDFRGEN